jgi:hypothetical protein
VEPTKGKELDNLYNMTAWMDDYVNPTVMVYLVGEVLVLVHQIQKKPWRIGNRDCMKYLQGDVLILPTHCDGLELRYVIPKYDGLTM